MLFPFPQKSVFAASMLIAATLTLTACQQDLESSQAFQDQVASVEAVTEDLKATIRQVSMLDTDLQQLRRQAESAGQEGVDSEALAAIEQRLLRLEDVLRKTGQSVASFDKRLSDLEQKQTQIAGQIGKVEQLARQAESPKTRVVASAETQPRTAAQPTTTERAKPAGTYHLVREGETLAGLAQRYGAGASEIRKANRLPAGRELIPGQQVYIPLR